MKHEITTWTVVFYSKSAHLTTSSDEPPPLPSRHLPTHVISTCNHDDHPHNHLRWRTMKGGGGGSTQRCLGKFLHTTITSFLLTNYLHLGYMLDASPCNCLSHLPWPRRPQPAPVSCKDLLVASPSTTLAPTSHYDSLVPFFSFIMHQNEHVHATWRIWVHSQGAMIDLPQFLYLSHNFYREWKERVGKSCRYEWGNDLMLPPKSLAMYSPMHTAHWPCPLDQTPADDVVHSKTEARHRGMKIQVDKLLHMVSHNGA